MALELVANLGQPGWAGFDAEASAAVRRSLQAKATDDPDFWCYAGLIEIEMLEAVASGTLADALPALEDRHAELFGRVTGRNLWGSVADQANLVLSAYAEQAAGREAEAAKMLLAVLRGYTK
jgi:hypothetical protein